jgi:hypothetical protein
MRPSCRQTSDPECHLSAAREAVALGFARNRHAFLARFFFAFLAGLPIGRASEATALAAFFFAFFLPAFFFAFFLAGAATAGAGAAFFALFFFFLAAIDPSSIFLIAQHLRAQ